jgi:hypothetical protein
MRGHLVKVFGRGAMRVMRIWLACILVAISVSCLSATPADEEAIRELQTRWDDAWNRHDIKALSTPDHEFVPGF